MSQWYFLNYKKSIVFQKFIPYGLPNPKLCECRDETVQAEKDGRKNDRLVAPLGGAPPSSGSRPPAFILLDRLLIGLTNYRRFVRPTVPVVIPLGIPSCACMTFV
ncbi:hypothetical protein OUZ56_015285 [Daphnia magna]|uniref:Uncharacterized protein n=1 Tax=Daphnia magna TaxID=35525 RepID=A0ABR0AMD9_9CRUS|nr:hypothetical protein OUZ56_015285 [Daphnia magna]